MFTGIVQVVGDVRILGLMCCIELVKNRETKEPIVEFNTSPALVDEIKSQFRQRGLYAYVRWNLIFFAPPLITEAEHVAEATEILDEVLSWIESRALATA